jgi:hypothetical protein
VWSVSIWAIHDTIFDLIDRIVTNGNLESSRTSLWICNSGFEGGICCKINTYRTRHAWKPHKTSILEPMVTFPFARVRDVSSFS